MPATANPGDTVAVHYTGKLDDGSVFDSSKDRDPIQFTLGENRVIPGFEKAITGMTQGEKKTTKIAAEDAYGQRQDGLMVEFPRDKIPSHIPAEVGQELQVTTTDGRAMPAVVVKTSESAVTLDANHPLAGKDLTFDLELVEVVGQK